MRRAFVIANSVFGSCWLTVNATFCVAVVVFSSRLTSECLATLSAAAAACKL